MLLGLILLLGANTPSPPTAAERCGGELTLAPRGVHSCPGYRHLVGYTGSGASGPTIFKVHNANGDLLISAVEDGYGELIFDDGSRLAVTVRSCLQEQRQFERRAQDHGFEGLRFHCQGEMVYATAEFPQPFGVVQVLERWEDQHDLVFQDSWEPPPLALRIQVARVIREDGEQWGLDWSRPVDTLETLAGLMTGQRPRSLEELLVGPGKLQSAGSWTDEYTFPLEQGSSFEQWMGATVRTISAGTGDAEGSEDEHRSGFRIAMRDVTLLSGGRAVRGFVEVSYSSPGQAVRRGGFMVTASDREVGHSAMTRLYLNEPTKLIVNQPQQEQSSNSTLPFLEDFGSLEQLIGGKEHSEREEMLLVVVTLVPRSTDGSDAAEDFERLRREGAQHHRDIIRR